MVAWRYHYLTPSEYLLLLLWLWLLLVSLALCAVNRLYNVAEIKSILDRWGTHNLLLLLLLLVESSILLNLSGLLLASCTFLHAFAPEVLQVPKTAIVLDVVNDSSEVVLLR